MTDQKHKTLFERYGSGKTISIEVIIIFLIANIFLAVASNYARSISTLFAVGTLMIAVLVVFRRDSVEGVIPLLAYITGAEIIWRGTHAAVFYEYGKYAVSFIAIMAIFKYRLIGHVSKAPFFYLILLLPSIFVMPVFDRSAISFNLSGPLSLALCTILCGAARINTLQVRWVLLALIGPAIGLGALAAFTSFTSEELVFVQASNFITSAGIGPNQVSSILGLGAVAAFIYAILERSQGKIRHIMILLMIYLLAQTMMTLSRGGFWTGIGAIFVFSCTLHLSEKWRPVVVKTSLIVLIIGLFIALPTLSKLTDGVLTERFNDTGTTGRTKIIQGDWEAFIANPILGVGPNQSKTFHELFFRYSSTHTEYSRLLAEHGSLGLLALLILLWIVMIRLFEKADPLQKGFSLIMTTWALLFMYHAAMRLVAPSFIFGLGGAHLFSKEVVTKNVHDTDEEV